MKREIVELDDLLLIEAGLVAKQQGKTLDEVVGAALRQYVDANIRPPDLSSIIGMFQSDGSFSSDPEEIDRELMEGIDPYEGWSHDPRPPDRNRAHG
jgi:hypothetical protein